MHRVLVFLGSMSLAVTLLVVVSIASVIGTVLQQNQNYTDYQIRFGEFYFDVFRVLGLYDVYSAPWFALIMAFLLISVTTCVIRQSPGRVKRISNWSPIKRGREENTFSERSNINTDQFIERVSSILGDSGYSVKISDDKIVARKNRFHPLGYVFTHVAIILIIIGALIDSNPLTQYRLLRGDVVYETKSMPVSQLPQNRFLPPENLAFRGNVNISEGNSASVVFLNHKDGYMVQTLPFKVRVDDFRIEHYDNGQPKSFESDIVVTDLAGIEPETSTTISVNKPLRYMGVDIYQASFSDGGSRLKLSSRNLRQHDSETGIETAVGQSEIFKNNNADYLIEVDDFRLFNIENFAEPDAAKPEWRNVGPSVSYKVRRPDGTAVEYLSYQVPVLLDGEDFFYFAYREDIGNPLTYVRIPADPFGKLDWFNQYYANLTNDSIRNEAITQLINSSLGEETTSKNEAIRGALELSALFVDRGFNAIEEWVRNNVESANQAKVLDHYVRVIRMANELIFFRTLSELGIEDNEVDTETISDFFVNAVTAASDMSHFPIGIVVQLDDFEHIQAAGLQMTKSPGRALVYPGCLLLTIGIFIMFYLNEKRIMVQIKRESEHSLSWDIVGKADKRRDEFGDELNEYRNQLRSITM